MKDKNAALRFITLEFMMACLTSFLARLGLQLRNTASPLYIQDLGFNKSAAGLATTTYTISALFFRPVVGKVIDKFGCMIVSR